MNFNDFDLSMAAFLQDKVELSGLPLPIKIRHKIWSLAIGWDTRLPLAQPWHLDIMVRQFDEGDRDKRILRKSQKALWTVSWFINEFSELRIKFFRLAGSCLQAYYDLKQLALGFPPPCAWENQVIREHKKFVQESQLQMKMFCELHRDCDCANCQDLDKADVDFSKTLLAKICKAEYQLSTCRKLYRSVVRSAKREELDRTFPERLTKRLVEQNASIRKARDDHIRWHKRRIADSYVRESKDWNDTQDLARKVAKMTLN